MSILVELPLELYDPHAFDVFLLAGDFHRGCVRAMAWMSQLAYETDHPDTFLQMLTDVSVLGAAEQVGLTISGAHRRRGSPRSSAL